MCNTVFSFITHNMGTSSFIPWLILALCSTHLSNDIKMRKFEFLDLICFSLELDVNHTNQIDYVNLRYRR